MDLACIFCGASGTEHAPGCMLRKVIDTANEQGGEHWILNDAHEPVAVNFETYVRWKKNNREACHVAYDQLTPTAYVSTLFFGQNLDIRRDIFPHLNLPPLLFETCAFDSGEIIRIERSYTWTEAEIEHAAALAMMRERERAKARAANN